MATGRLPDPNTAPVTAKGDLYTYSTVPAKLAVGSDGETLVADSSASVGLRYQEPKAGNPVINSAFQVWQRGTSFSLAASTGTTYLADRWMTFTGANQACTISRQTTSDTTNLPFIQYALRYARNSGQTGTGGLWLAQSFESVNSIPFAGKTVTLSFYARRGANYSATNNLLDVYLTSGTGTDQNIISGYTGSNNVIGSNVTLTTTWQRFSLSATVPTTATELSPFFVFNPTGTAGANDYYEITGVQLEAGSVATPFRTQGVTLAGELAACKRYFERHSASSTLGYGPYAAGFSNFATAANFAFKYETEKRAQPTITFGPSVAQFMASYRGNSGTGASTLTAGNITRFGSIITLVPSGTPFTQGDGMLLTDAGSAVSYIDISSEL